MTVVLHELGHVLGIGGIEPGEYNIYPQHVGGLNNVLVLEDNDSGQLAGGRTLAEVRDAAGHANLTIASGYLHVAVEEGKVGALFG